MFRKLISNLYITREYIISNFYQTGESIYLSDTRHVTQVAYISYSFIERKYLFTYNKVIQANVMKKKKNYSVNRALA